MPLFKKHGLQDPDLADTQAGIATQAMLGRARLGSVTSGELLILRETQCVLCKHFRGGTSVVVIPTTESRADEMAKPWEGAWDDTGTRKRSVPCCCLSTSPAHISLGAPAQVTYQLLRPWGS